MTVHYAGGNSRPLCNNAPFRDPPLPVTSSPDEVTCGTCRSLLKNRHLRVLPRPDDDAAHQPQVDPADADTVRSTETPDRPGYYHDDTGREFTVRGFQVYGRIIDTHGVEARIQESSSASEDAVWIFTASAEDLHLNLEQAVAFRDALDVFISIKSPQ